MEAQGGVPIPALHDPMGRIAGGLKQHHGISKPMIAKLFRSLALGIKRRWWPSIVAAFSIAGAIWTATEFTTGLFNPVKSLLEANNTTYLLMVAACGLVAFLYKAYEPLSVSFKIPTTQTNVTIEYGDIFDEKHGNILFAVNEFFDHDLGQVVDPKSIHGQFIQNFFNSDNKRFRSETDAALTAFTGEVVQRGFPPVIKYPIGTTVMLHVGGRKAFLFALTKTDLVTHKATTTVPLLWDGLIGAWQTVHSTGNGDTLTLPLIGNGRASLNLKPQHILRILVLSLADFSRRQNITNEIKIVVPLECFKFLDLREIARDWSA